MTKIFLTFIQLFLVFTFEATAQKNFEETDSFLFNVKGSYHIRSSECEILFDDQTGTGQNLLFKNEAFKSLELKSKIGFRLGELTGYYYHLEFDMNPDINISSQVGTTLHRFNEQDALEVITNNVSKSPTKYMRKVQRFTFFQNSQIRMNNTLLVRLIFEEVLYESATLAMPNVAVRCVYNLNSEK